jgi:hypothetical protein
MERYMSSVVTQKYVQFFDDTRPPFTAYHKTSTTARIKYLRLPHT